MIAYYPGLWSLTMGRLAEPHRRSAMRWPSCGAGTGIMSSSICAARLSACVSLPTSCLLPGRCRPVVIRAGTSRRSAAICRNGCRAVSWPGSLEGIFCADYDFLIPDYQRPYAWGTEQAAELLDDLSGALDRDEGEPYFLGSIVLIKQPDVPRAEVVDGQQRLTTLTILFAVLAYLAADEETCGVPISGLCCELGFL